MNKSKLFLATVAVVVCLILNDDNQVESTDLYSLMQTPLVSNVISTIPIKAMSLFQLFLLGRLLSRQGNRGQEQSQGDNDDDEEEQEEGEGEYGKSKKKNVMIFMGKHNIQVSNHDMKYKKSYDKEEDDDDDDDEDDDEDDDNDNDDDEEDDNDNGSTSTTESTTETTKKNKNKKKNKKSKKSSSGGNTSTKAPMNWFFETKRNLPIFRKFWSSDSMNSRINVKPPPLYHNPNNHIISSPNGFPLGGSKLEKMWKRTDNSISSNAEIDPQVFADTGLSESEINSVLAVPEYKSLLTEFNNTLYDAQQQQNRSKRSTEFGGKLSAKRLAKNNFYVSNNTTLSAQESQEDGTIFGSKAHPNHESVGSVAVDEKQFKNLDIVRLGKNFSTLLPDYMTKNLVYTSDYNPFNPIQPRINQYYNQFPNNQNNNRNSSINLNKNPSDSSHNQKGFTHLTKLESQTSVKALKSKIRSSVPSYQSSNKDYSQAMSSQSVDPYYGESITFDDSDEYSPEVINGINYMNGMYGMKGTSDMSEMGGMKVSPMMSTYMMNDMKTESLPVMDLSYWAKLIKKQEEKDSKSQKKANKKKKKTTTEMTTTEADDDDDEDEEEDDDDDDEEYEKKKENKYHTTVQIIKMGTQAGNVGINSGQKKWWPWS